MININLQLVNPWSNRFEPVYYWGKKLTKHKALELQIYRSEAIAEFEFRLSFARQDHAGLTLGLGLFTWTAHFVFHDVRHWDYENNCWIKYDDQTENNLL